MNTEETTAYEPLLKESGAPPTEYDTLVLAYSVEQTRRWKIRFHMLLLVFVMTALSCFIGSVVLYKTGSVKLTTKHRDEAVEPYSPVADIVEYENRWILQDPNSSKFVGKPRPELDKAWKDLLDGTLIRITEDDLRKANATSIALQQGGYAVGLGISHNLHCLKRIKQFMYAEHYYLHPEQHWEVLQDHVEHCLESIRQALLCNVDISLYTLEWNKDSRTQPGINVPQPHKCTNWRALHAWMQGRAASIEDLVRPDDSFFDEN